MEEITQPQGHSTSGSHERYKSPERLDWEREWDGIRKMKEWLIGNELASEEELDEIAEKAKELVRESKASAWAKFVTPIKKQVARATELIHAMANALPEKSEELHKVALELSANREPLRRDVQKGVNTALTIAGDHDAAFWTKDFYKELQEENKNSITPIYTTKDLKAPCMCRKYRP